VSAAVGIALVHAAVEENLAQIPVTNATQQVHEAMWRPECPHIEIGPDR
jgi:hypothetical protein